MVKMDLVEVILQEEFVFFFIVVGQMVGDIDFIIEFENCDVNIYSSVQVCFEGIFDGIDVIILKNEDDVENIGV